MKFSIATFNVENLVLAGKSIDGRERPRYTSDQYHEKIKWVKHQLLTMNADIVGFQEIYDDQALRDCIAGTPYEHWHVFSATREINKGGNAIISKFPVISAKSIETIPFMFDFFDSIKTVTEQFTSISIPIKRFSRALLRAEIALRDDTTLIVYVAHLKSKHPILQEDMNRDTASYTELAKGSIRSLIRRGIEAAGIRALLSEEIDQHEHNPIIFLGDLNDTGTVVTNQIILGDPPFFKLPEEEKIKRWKYTFQDSADIQARKSLEDFHFTYIHNGRHESLDNIFISNHFASLNKQAIGRVVDLRVYNDHVIDQTVSFDKKPIYVSDHGQVVLNAILYEK